MQEITGALQEPLAQLGGIFGVAFRSAAIVLIISILVGAASKLTTSGDKTVDLAGVLVISLLAVGDARTFMGLGRETIVGLSDFSKILLPALAAAAAASGAPASSAAQFAITALFMDILITVSKNILTPMIFCYLAAEIAGAASDSEIMSAAAGFLKWACATVLTIIVLAFVLFLSISGIVGNATDVAAIRVTKTAISTALPVVGGILTDAAGSVLAGAMTLRNTIGITGMASILTISLIPFLHLGAQYLLYKASSKLSAGVAGGRISKLVNGIASAFGLCLASVGACGLMLFFSLISMLSVRGE
ncbi:MAG: stage III sporulation protein AE [Oscillospiraceae bacterium]|jgi:stage III sporulation protein AE|nr:stage III sporulation protein AE [Oscillospiraceae bacterium]